MDRAEAQALVRERLAELRELSYEELKGFMTHEHEETLGPSGTTYQLDVYAFWDGGRHAAGGDLRVSVAIDDGGWRAFVPLVEDFIISPTGEFIGE